MPLIVANIGFPNFIEEGDYYYRMYSPCAALAALNDVYTIDIKGAHREMANVMLNADVVVLNHYFSADFLPMIKKRKAEKKLTVFEISDDFMHVPNWNPSYRTYQNPDIQQLVKRMAWYCDGVQFTSEGLNRQYGYLNPQHAVFPNQIIAVPTEKRPCDGNIRIGWSGSYSHLEDVDIIAKHLVPFLNNTPNVHFCFMGSEDIFKSFNNIPESKKTFYKIGTIYDYYDFLKNIDIGIAPLEDTPFNRSRSDVKFLEYAVNSVVPVVSNISTYDAVEHGRTGYLFTGSTEMITILKDLASDKNKVQTIGKQAREYVIANRLQSQHAADHLSFYAEGLSHIGWTEDAASINYWRHLTGIAGAEQNNRYLKLQYTDYEILLFGGYIYSTCSERLTDAINALRRAAALCQNDYRPYLYMIGPSSDKIPAINEALLRNPESISSIVQLGDLLSRQGKKIESLECYQRAATIFPEYDVPFQRIAALLESMGDLDSAREFHQIVANMRIR